MLDDTTDQKPKTGLVVRTPTNDLYMPWMFQEMPRYKAAVEYMAFFFEQRAGMGDMSTSDLWAEFKQNVCISMRDGLHKENTQ